MDTIRPWHLPREVRELRAEDSGVTLDFRDFGGARTGSCGTGGSSNWASALLVRKSREPGTCD
jgi:hypothetical protein